MAIVEEMTRINNTIRRKEEHRKLLDREIANLYLMKEKREKKIRLDKTEPDMI